MTSMMMMMMCCTYIIGGFYYSVQVAAKGERVKNGELFDWNRNPDATLSLPSFKVLPYYTISYHKQSQTDSAANMMNDGVGAGVDISNSI
jgi:hypothetical protein